MSARKSKKKLKKAKARRYHVSTLAHTVIRLPRPRVEIDRGKHWYVCWTGVQAERRAERGLQAAGFATYLPTMAEMVVKRGKRHEVERLPVGRYLFVGLHAAGLNFGGVRDVDGVESLLSIDGTPVRIPSRLLQQFADHLTAQDRQQAERRQFHPGQRVSAVGGPFLSIPGYVI